MGRTIDRSAGLALLGVGAAGPLSFSLPTLMWAQSATPVPPDRPEQTVLSAEPGGQPGRRRVILSQGDRRLDLEFPVPVPEVSGIHGAAHEAQPGIWIVHAPLTLEASSRLRGSKPQMVVLGNARDLWREGEPFVRAIRDLREGVGAAPLLWAPRVALPHRLAFLVYVGVDVLDTTEGWIDSLRPSFTDATLGSMDPDPKARRRQCPCPACQADPMGPLGHHAEWAYDEEMRRVRSAASQGRLRELVEARLTAEPSLAEMLRYADRLLYPLLDERTAVVGTDSRTYVLSESFRRPEVRRYRDRFLERYRPPPSKEVLLLVPCSRTKPYRSSRSHRRFLRAMEGLPNLERVHFVSVTSPLGLVPRELEDVYPARHYDIPVTGEWSEAEREAVARALAHLLATGGYREIVVHLDADEYAFLGPTLEGARPVRWSLVGDRSTSAESLASLSGAIAEAGRSSTHGRVAGGPLTVVREELEAVAAFQFGISAASRLFVPPSRLAGRPWFQRLTDGKSVDLATWREERGLFQLTVAGARRLVPDPPLAVEVAEGVVLAGDLFTPGVERADPLIRVGDAVVLMKKGELVGVGEAELPGPMMTQMPRGLAVHVRHRSHAGAPPSLVADPVLQLTKDDGPVV